MSNTINCVSNCSTEIPQQCLDCGKLKVCLDLNAIKWKTCTSRDIGGDLYDPLQDFKPVEEP